MYECSKIYKEGDAETPTVAVAFENNKLLVELKGSHVFHGTIPVVYQSHGKVFGKLIFSWNYPRFHGEFWVGTGNQHFTKTL